MEKCCLKGRRFSYFIEVELKNGCTISQSFHFYDYENAKKTYDEMCKHEDVAFVRLVECNYLFEKDGEE